MIDTTECIPAASGATTKIDYKAALAMKSKGMTYKQIASELGCKPNTLKITFSRKGYVGAVSKATNSVRSVTVQNVSRNKEGASDRARNSLIDELQGQLNILAKEPMKYADLPNTGQGRAAMVKTVAESLKIAHSWGNEAGSMTFGLVLLSDAQEVIEAKVMDVESSVSPEAPACGVNEPKQDNGTQGQTPQVESCVASG